MEQQSVSAPEPSATAANMFDVNLFTSRLSAMFQNPVSALEQAKSEPGTFFELFQRYVVALVVAPAVCGFIGLSLFGPLPIGLGVKMLIFRCVLGLGGVYAATYLIQALAPRFGGTATQTDILKWIICGSFVAAAAGVLSLISFIPIISMLVLLVQFAAAIYSLYVLWLGMPILLGITGPRRLTFLLSYIGCVFVIMLVVVKIGLL